MGCKLSVSQHEIYFFGFTMFKIKKNLKTKNVVKILFADDANSILTKNIVKILFMDDPQSAVRMMQIIF